MSLRLFTAIRPPEEILARLAHFPYDAPRLAWRPYENLHITLCFHGEIPEDIARDLDRELDAIRREPFELRLQGAGVFNGRSPGALWIGLAPSPVLSDLAQACARAGRRAGAPADPSPFRPHLTLAYGRNARDTDAAEFIQRFSPFVSESFWVDACSLYSSWRTRSGGQYVEEARYTLGRAL